MEAIVGWELARYHRGANSNKRRLRLSDTTPRWNANQVYEALRQMIVNFELAPGTRITETRLAEYFNLSRTPIRQALQRLEAEGHLTIRPKQGCFIRPLDIVELSHYYDVRIGLELRAIELAAEHMPREELAALASDWNPETMKYGCTVTDELKLAEEQFHLRLVEGCRNPVLLRYMIDLHDKIRIIRRLGWPDYESITDTYKDHHEICTLILAGQIDEAKALMVRHIKHSQELARRVTLDQLAQHHQPLPFQS